MPKSRAAMWFLISMMSVWISSAAAELPVVADDEELHGVVIEEIPEGSALERAGLQIGDVITAWKRLPSPPANPDAAESTMRSYFDWQVLEVEEAPRGTVVLLGHRGNEPLEAPVTPGVWDAKVRPLLSEAGEATYIQGKAYLATGDFGGAVRTWKTLVDLIDGNTKAWLTLRIGVAWGEKGDWEKAAAQFRAVLGMSQSTSAQLTAWQYLAMAELRRNDYQAADAALGAALEICKKKGAENLCTATSVRLEVK